VATKYYDLNGLRVAEERAGVRTWCHSDHVQSATVVTDVDGNEVRRMLYTAFGEAAQNRGTGRAPRDTDTGKEYDATDLYYYGARYYDPALGRFISPDTQYDAGPQGLNRYSYALNNPIIYRDPTGHLSYAEADPNDEQTWSAPTIPIITTTQGEDTYKANAAEVKQEQIRRAGELRPAPKRSYLRTNFVSRYLGDVIMFGESIVAPQSSWNDCNRVTGDCYSAGESFDRRFGVFTDIASSIAMGAVTKVSKIASQGQTKIGEKLYRGLAEGEDITKGLSARAPGAGNSPLSHVAGKRQSQWISTTKESQIAIQKYGSRGVVEIDTSKITTEIVDLSEGFNIRGMLSNWAKKDVEVLIKDFIPAEAITRIK
jgi:RHS repeat-associated protein